MKIAILKWSPANSKPDQYSIHLLDEDSTVEYFRSWLEASRFLTGGGYSEVMEKRLREKGKPDVIVNIFSAPS